LNIENLQLSCLLITVEDRDKAIKNIAVEEAQSYRLTRREKEVWLLHRDRYTYKQIASELCITPNTVKKHMKSIHAKQKENCSRRA
jgi:DNA-binding CsgD family transcriptional regulator